MKEKCQCEENHKCNDKCTCEEDCTCNDECTCSEQCDCIKEEKKEHKEKKIKKDKHTDKLNEAYNKISELEDNLLRSKADFINYRKRLEEEQTRMLKYSNEDLVKEMLPIIDSLERAIDMNDSENEETNKFLSGVKMVYCNLINILEKYGVKAIDGNNKPFDPAYHQAVMTEHVDNMQPGIVIDVLQKGYLLKDKVIRSAMVKVSE